MSVYKIVGTILGLWLRLAFWLSRVRIEGGETRDATLKTRQPVVYAVWHGALPGLCLDGIKGLKGHVITSKSKDGDLAEAVFARAGLKTLRGSSRNPLKPQKDKGGREAMEEAIASLRGGRVTALVLTPDGPRGPRGQAKHGVATIAIRAGVPVVPVGFASSHAIRFNSWDQAHIPLPFGKVALVWGQPIAAPELENREAVEAMLKNVQTELNRVTCRAEALVNRTPDPAYSKDQA